MNRNIIELTSKDFSGKIINTPVNPKRGIIMFKADWCGFCKRAKPEFEQSAKLLKGMFTFYIVDADKSPELIKRYDIQGFPTIKFVDNDGKIYKDYSGDRNVQSFLDTICLEASVCKKYK